MQSNLTSHDGFCRARTRVVRRAGRPLAGVSRVTLYCVASLLLVTPFSHAAAQEPGSGGTVRSNPPALRLIVRPLTESPGSAEGISYQLAPPQPLRSGTTSDSPEVDYPGGQSRRSAGHLTEMEFSLRPGNFDFSLAGGFGLGGVFSNPEFAMRSDTTRRERLYERLPQVHRGLSYSAGIRIEHDDEHISDTAYVSSSQLGLSYGRLGRVWYSGVDFSFQQRLNDDHSPAAEAGDELFSFDLTTGRRMWLTGQDRHDPLWMLTLRGDFDIQSETIDGNRSVNPDGDWYLNPSLFWERPGFRFSAQLELPVDSTFLRDFEEPDYTLRAVIEKSLR